MLVIKENSRVLIMDDYLYTKPTSVNLCQNFIVSMYNEQTKSPALPNPRSPKSLNDVAQFCSIVDTLVKTVYRVNSHSLLCLQNSD